MLNLGVIAPVDRPTDWVNIIVLSETKNDKGEVTKLRVYQDPRDLNKWAKREHNRSKIVDEVIPSSTAVNFSPLSTQIGDTGTYHSTKKAPTSQPSSLHSADIASNVSHLALLFHKTCCISSSTQHSKTSRASPVSLTTHLYMDHLKLSMTET